MIQGILVTIFFLAALTYLVRIVYKQLQAKAACATGCGKCGAIDFKKIEAELAKKNPA